jgi:hypothetical protein
MIDISVKAGKNVYEMIQDGGFDMDRVTTYVGPGVGPRWLLATGFDLTLLSNGLLGRSHPVVLAGSSAGALRFAAWLQPEAVESYRRLMEAYITTSYTRDHTPETILESIQNIVNAYIENDAIPFALANKKYRLAVTTARARNFAASEMTVIQQLALACSFIFNAVKSSWISWFFERVVFYNGPLQPRFCLRDGFKGMAIQLNDANFKHALLASSAIPLIVAGVKNIYGAPNGVYRDGGVMDYHLNQNYAETKDDVVLLFNHQERVIPGWLDKRLKYREIEAEFLANVLMINPSEQFIQKLPGGKIPDREDFKLFIDDPVERIKYWWQAVELSAPLGEQFMELVESKRIRSVVEEL